jgi:hypothetical protein
VKRKRKMKIKNENEKENRGLALCLSATFSGTKSQELVGPLSSHSRCKAYHMALDAFDAFHIFEGQGDNLNFGIIISFRM